MTKLATRDLRLYKSILTETPYCYACGWSPNTSKWKPDWWVLHRMHLAAGGGKMKRFLDRRAVVVGCYLCHIHLHKHNPGQTKLDGRVYPYLSDANVLWLKRERDPEFFDWDWICSKWIGNPPTPCEPAAYFMDLFRERRP